jgi:hypothetical protein
MEIAGGMVYQTNEEVESAGLMSYFSEQGGAVSPKILEQEKAYYIASADKTAARLELAKARITEANIPEDDRRMFMGRLDTGVKWTDSLKQRIRGAPDKATFDAVVSQSYKKWHAVKLLPSAAEGYAIVDAIEAHIDLEQNDAGLRDAKDLIERSRAIFLQLLYLEENADFTVAEQSRLEAFRYAKNAREKLNAKHEACGQSAYGR